MKIEAKGIRKIYTEGEKPLAVLDQLDFSAESGKKIGIVGASGTGKSTLLHILGGLDAPSHGSVWFDGQDLYQKNETERSQFRNRQLGFVFQFYHLLNELSALENVALPTWIAGFSRKEGLQVAHAALERVGLTERKTFFPKHLSGGECQRVALARACVLKPKLLLADEPTGNLDPQTGEEVFRYLLEVVAEVEGTLILVTHNLEMTKGLDAVYRLEGGKLHAA